METIAAISTAPGNGGIGIIRMSGKDSFKILEKIFKSSHVNFESIEGYTMKYGFIINSENGQKIDEVLVSFFKNPKSYTREDMCEINSHGGIIVEKMILEQCLKNGATLAEPGEFTKRAFLNGRIDLAQAESIIDIINSKTEKETKAAMNQLKGVVSNEINEIKSSMLDIMADINATIDYPEYDLEDVTNIRIISIIKQINNRLEKLKNSFNNGKILKEGIKTAIIGKPNTGKSSLLNAILKEDRAIVSDIEGTTRDTIEEYVTINGICLKLIDTAGIRKTDCKIEEIGVKKSINISDDADLILALFDNSKDLTEEDIAILDIIKNKDVIVLLNKIDIEDKSLETKEEFKEFKDRIIKISANKEIGLEQLYKKIEEMYGVNDFEIDNSSIITNIRHKQEIEKAIDNLEKAKNEIENNMQIDIVSIYIKEALENLGAITGDNISEDIINKIFSKFCLGK